jgi:hypothetical protein
MKKLRAFAILNFLFLCGHIAVAYATNAKLISNRSVGDVSDQYESLFTPAGMTFSIWGLIYTTLLAYCIYHLVVAFTKPLLHPANMDLSRTGIWFTVNSLAAIAWLLTWTGSNLAMATILIVVQLITLMIIHIRSGIHDPYASAGTKIFTYFPLSIYFGWITIAVIANISVYLVSIQWDGMGWGYANTTWAQFIIGFAILLTVVVVLVQRNVFYGLVVIWGLYGIKSKREDINPEEYSAVIQTAWIGIGVIGITCLIQLINNLSKKSRKEKFTLSKPDHPQRGQKSTVRVDRTV